MATPLKDNGRLRWAWLLEWVFPPVFGFGIITLAVAGVPIPGWVETLVPGLILFPFARQVDKLRREK